MITIYEATETTFENNGLAVLEPITCYLSVAINGAWAVELEHPFDEEGKYLKIEKNRILKIDNIPIIREHKNNTQLFRIYDTVKTLSTIKAIAFPVAFEATYDAIIEELKIAKKNAPAALQDIMTYLSQHDVTKYTVTSDYSMVTPKQAKGSWADTNLIAAISGSDDGSIINGWGGEVAYDNYTIIVNGKLGSEKNYEVRYGKNLTGLSVDTDMSGVVTRLYPKGSDGTRLKHTVGGAEVSYVDSANISQYPHVRAAFVDTEYQLIDSSFEENKPNTAQAVVTHTAQTQVTSEIQAVATSFWNAIKTGTPFNNKWYEPEWVQSVLDDVIKTLQADLTANIEHPTWKSLLETCIKDGISWIKNYDLPEFYWDGDDTNGYTYTNGERDIKGQYFYVDKRYCNFNAAGNYIPENDVDTFDWIQKKNTSAKKKYGNNQRYYARGTYVYTMGGDGSGGRQFNQYYFDGDGWWDGTDFEASEWDWHQDGNKWWFGASDAGTDENKYAHDCWLYIKATDDSTPKLFYFNSQGYSDPDLETSTDWGWHQKKNNWYFGSTSKTQNAVYAENQWLKIDGEWCKFDTNGYLVKMDTLKTQLTTLLKNAINSSAASTITYHQNALYTSLYEQMINYCEKLYEQDEIDQPAVNVTVNMVDLRKTPEYGDILEELPTPSNYWNCDDEWKSTGFSFNCPWFEGMGAPYTVKKHSAGVACCARILLGPSVESIICIAKNEDDVSGDAFSYYGRGWEGETKEFEDDIIYVSTHRADRDYEWTNVNEDLTITLKSGYIRTLDFYGEFGRFGTYDEQVAYLLKVSHFTTKKRDLSGIHLGDSVKVIDYVHGYNINERAVGLKYDCIKGYITEVTIDKLSKAIDQITGGSVGSKGGKLETIKEGQQLIAGEGVTINNGVIGVNVSSGNTYNGTQVSVSPTITTGIELAKIYINGSPVSIYAEESGSDVVVTPTLNSGTKIADVSVDGDNQSLYAPSYTPGTNVQINNGVISATDTTYNDFSGSTHGLVPAPASGDSGKYLKGDGTWDEPSGAEVDVTAYYQSGNKVATIEVDGADTDIYAPFNENVINVLPVNRQGWSYISGSEQSYSVDANTGEIDIHSLNGYISGNQFTAVRTVPISPTVSKIRFKVKFYLSSFPSNPNDTYKWCIGIKSTLDTSNFADPTDNDWIVKKEYAPSYQNTEQESEISFEISSNAYLYITANGWTCDVLECTAVENTGVSSLDALEDVNISSPSNGQVLKYNSTSQKWENSTASGAAAQALTQSQYDALSQAQKENGTIYFVKADSNYEYHASQDGTMVVRIDNDTNERLFFFCGVTKTASDMAVPSEVLAYVPSGLWLTSNYPDGGTVQNGWIGFYNNNIRTWDSSTSQTVGGTFYGVMDLNGNPYPTQQINPYFDPYNISTKIYYMGTEYASKN